MKKTLWAVVALLVPAVSSLVAASVTVNKSGSGNYTNIQAAIDSGATLITITDSGNYVENIDIGTQDGGGTAVTLTSNQSGTNRPVITPSALRIPPIVNAARPNQQAGFVLFANNSVISNLIIEAHPQLNVGGLFIMAQNVLVESCLFRLLANTTNTLGASVPLLYFGQEGDGTGALTPGTNPKPGGRDSNGCLVRNSEFLGVAPDAIPLEPIGNGFDENSIENRSAGYLLEKRLEQGTGQGSGYVRCDHVTDGQNVFITLEGCWFHYDRDYGIFPTDNRNGAGSVNIVIKKCRFDAQGKFQVRGRGANIFVENSIFTRANQLKNNDEENSAVAINANGDGQHVPTGSVSNCVFVNCGSANAQRAYYGGVNAHRGTSFSVDRSTFVDCVSGVSAGRGGSGTLSVSNSIFHQIGDNVPRSVNANYVTLTNGSPELEGGLYLAWSNGLPNFGVDKWSAVFNRATVSPSQILIGNCLVGTVDNEDTRSWEDALNSSEVTGCRLFAGWESNFVSDTILRAIPVFVTTDPDAPNAFQLAAGSPGQGLGANLAPVLSPNLIFQQSGNQLNISWTQPIWVKGALSSSSSLDSPVWTPVAGVTNNTATVTIGSGNQYFAIIKQ